MQYLQLNTLLNFPNRNKQYYLNYFKSKRPIGSENDQQEPVNQKTRITKLANN